MSAKTVKLAVMTSSVIALAAWFVVVLLGVGDSNKPIERIWQSDTPDVTIKSLYGTQQCGQSPPPVIQIGLTKSTLPNAILEMTGSREMLYVGTDVASLSGLTKTTYHDGPMTLYRLSDREGGTLAYIVFPHDGHDAIEYERCAAP